MLEVIPNIPPARRIAKIPVVFVLPEQSVGWRTVRAYRLSRKWARKRHESEQYCIGNAKHLEPILICARRIRPLNSRFSAPIANLSEEPLHKGSETPQN